MVRERLRNGVDWNEQPIPILVVEVLSPSTRRRDREQKRSLYMDAGVPEYWLLDPERGTGTVVTSDGSDLTAGDVLIWHPGRAASALEIQLARLFG